MGVIRGDSYYVIVNGHAWSTAEANAINLGGNLVTVNDASESSWLGSEYSKSIYQYSGDDDSGSTTINHYWTGGKRNSNGDWEWSSGQNYDPPLSILVINNNDANHNRLLGIFNNTNHTQSPYLYLDDMDNTASGSYRGIAEIPLSYFSISDVSIIEGNSGNVTISRTGGTNSTQTIVLNSSSGWANGVNWGTANSTNDYTAISTSLTFTAGESSKTVSISTQADSSIESNETFTLRISTHTTPESADAVPPQIIDEYATVTIDDAALITGPSGSAGASTSSKSINENTTAIHTFTASETVT